MVNELIKMQIPFNTGKLEDVLNYLTGDAYFTVNKMEEHKLYV